MTTHLRTFDTSGNINFDHNMVCISYDRKTTVSGGSISYSSGVWSAGGWGTGWSYGSTGDYLSINGALVPGVGNDELVALRGTMPVTLQIVRSTHDSELYGTSFPSSPGDGWWWYRSDQNKLYQWSRATATWNYIKDGTTYGGSGNLDITHPGSVAGEVLLSTYYSTVFEWSGSFWQAVGTIAGYPGNVLCILTSNWHDLSASSGTSCRLWETMSGTTTTIPDTVAYVFKRHSWTTPIAGEVAMATFDASGNCTFSIKDGKPLMHVSTIVSTGTGWQSTLSGSMPPKEDYAVPSGTWAVIASRHRAGGASPAGAYGSSDYVQDGFFCDSTSISTAWVLQPYDAGGFPSGYTPSTYANWNYGDPTTLMAVDVAGY